MNANISVFVICVEAIIYLLLYNLHDCTFKIATLFSIATLISTINLKVLKMEEQIKAISSHVLAPQIWFIHWII